MDACSSALSPTNIMCSQSGESEPFMILSPVTSECTTTFPVCYSRLVWNTLLHQIQIKHLQESMKLMRSIITNTVFMPFMSKDLKTIGRTDTGEDLKVISWWSDCTRVHRWRLTGGAVRFHLWNVQSSTSNLCFFQSTCVYFVFCCCLARDPQLWKVLKFFLKFLPLKRLLFPGKWFSGRFYLPELKV